MQVMYILWLRELKRFWRSKAQLAGSLAQPLMYLLVLGFGLGPIFQKAGAGSFLQFMAPGIIAMTVLFSSVFCGMALLWDRQLGFLKETLVAPVPRIQLMLGRTLGAATVALLQGLAVALVCLVAGFKPVDLALVPAGLAFLTLIAIVFAALGTALGSVLRDMQGYSTIINFLVFPIFLLSGALFPLENLPALLAMLTSVDPLSYGVDGLRATLIGQTHFGARLDAVVVVCAAMMLTGLGAWCFGKIEI
jgi:ABC-2 type transport system permease protein